MQKLPLKKELDITNIFKKSAIAHKSLGELNGISNIIPNKNILINKDILEILFLHPYTKIEFLEKHLNITRKTASKYLKEIEKIGILKEKKIGRNRYFINIRLFDLLKKPII